MWYNFCSFGSKLQQIEMKQYIRLKYSALMYFSEWDTGLRTSVLAEAYMQIV